MVAAREVVVLGGVRTPVGNYGGSLKDFSPATLGAMVIQEAVGRAGVAPDDVGHVVFGHVIPTEKHDVYLARVAARSEERTSELQSHLNLVFRPLLLTKKDQ